MGLKFSVINYELDIDEQVLFIKEFRDLLNIDDSRNKKRGKQLLLYIYLREDLSIRNPLGSTSYESRKEKSEKLIFGKKGCQFTEDEELLVNLGIAAYVEYSSTPEERLLGTVNDMIDDQNNQMINLRKMMLEDDTEEKDTEDEKKDKIIDKNDKYNKILKGVLDNLKLLNGQKRTIIDQLKNNVGEQVRAGRNTSLIEDEVFIDIKSLTGK